MSGTLPIQSIVLTRVEGPSHLCDKPVTVTSWLEARTVLRVWADTAPEKGGYDKVDFVVWWEGLDEYRGRYDLVHWRCGKPDLAEHIRSQAYFHTGRWTPPHLTVERHETILHSEMSYRRIAGTYEHLIANADLDTVSHPAPQFEMPMEMPTVRSDRRVGSW